MDRFQMGRACVQAPKGLRAHSVKMQVTCNKSLVGIRLRSLIWLWEVS